MSKWCVVKWLPIVEVLARRPTGRLFLPVVQALDEALVERFETDHGARLAASMVGGEAVTCSEMGV